MKRLKADFFAKPTLKLAKDLIGKALFVNDFGGIITETEAYLPDDPASHSFCGKTLRNAAMFAKPGTLYVYRIYGVYHCINIVSEAEGIGAAVLIRGIIPFPSTVKYFQEKSQKNTLIKKLTNGPGKICKVLNLTLQDNFTDLCSEKSKIFLLNNKLKLKIKSAMRIGISKNKDKLWRFIAEDLNLEKLTNAAIF